MVLLLDLLLSPPADFACLLLTDGDPVHKLILEDLIIL